MANDTQNKPSISIQYTETTNCIDLAAGEILGWWHPNPEHTQIWLEQLCGLQPNPPFTLKIQDEDATAQPPHLRKLALAYSQPTLWQHLTVTQHLAYGLEQHGIPSYEAEPRIEKTLKDFALHEHSDAFPHTLDAEQQTRLNLARAYTIEPHILLLHQPLAHHPEHTRNTLIQQLRTLAKRDKQTILFTTDNPTTALTLADRIYYTQDDQPTQSATPTDLYKLPKSRKIAQATGPINLIEAKIIRAEGGLAYVSTPIGEFSGTLANPEDTPKDGSTAYLAIRPECLKLEDLYPPEENCIQGNLTGHTYNGSTATYQFKAQDTTLTITELNPRKLSHPTDKPLHAWCDPDDTLILTE